MDNQTLPYNIPRTKVGNQRSTKRTGLNEWHKFNLNEPNSFNRRVLFLFIPPHISCQSVSRLNTSKFKPPKCVDHTHTLTHRHTHALSKCVCVILSARLSKPDTRFVCVCVSRCCYCCVPGVGTGFYSLVNGNWGNLAVDQRPPKCVLDNQPENKKGSDTNFRIMATRGIIDRKSCVCVGGWGCECVSVSN